ncbi:MAG: DMT family transporter [Gammaproteobacteria bacterium]|nr:DMT family transporter [Gammaproteobacteria bacterium]
MMSDNLRGASWIVASSISATIMTIGIRALTPEIHSLQITSVRSVVGMIILLPLLLPRSGLNLATNRIGLHILRGVIGVISINCGYYSLTVLPLVTATALFFTTPLFVIALAPVMLGESVGWRRWTATLIGFTGTIMVVRHNPTGFDFATFTAVTASVLFALQLLIGKRLSVTERPTTIMFYFNVVLLGFSLPPAVTVWAWPTGGQLLLLTGVGVFASARTYFDIRGYASGEASFVAPFQYTRMIFMGVAGFILFAEIPRTSLLLGASLIVLCTLYIAEREARTRRGTGPLLHQPDDEVVPPSAR